MENLLLSIVALLTCMFSGTPGPQTPEHLPCSPRPPRSRGDDWTGNWRGSIFGLPPTLEGPGEGGGAKMALFRVQAS